MIRLAIALLIILAGPAWATTCPAIPYTFSNGTVADANQVNANFAALLTCSNSLVLASPTITGVATFLGSPIVSATTGLNINARGELKTANTFPSFTLNDTNATVTTGGLVRLSGDGAGVYAFQINTAVAGDFGSAITPLEWSPSGAIVLPVALAFQSVADSATPPTIASGGCTTGSAQSISASNGTAAFQITLGGATCGSTITLTLPASTTKWHCTADDITTPASSEVHQTAAASTTSVVLTNFVRTTGVAGNFTGADVLAVSCRGY